MTVTALFIMIFDGTFQVASHIKLILNRILEVWYAICPVYI